MSLSRVIEVSFNGGSIAYVKADTAYFYNNGIIFKPTDIDLPTSYQVHWSDSPQSTTTLETIGTAEGAPIPDDLWNRSRVIYGWIYLHPTENSGVTAYEVRIYKSVRAGLPDGTEPTPAEQSTIDQLISAMNSAVEQTGEDAESASQSAQSAESAKTAAESARDTAREYANNASASATSAQTSASQASASATASAQSASQSAQIKSDIEGMVDDAQGYADSASQSASQASASEQGCARAVLDAASAAAIARARADEASGYAQTASTKASEASTSAQTASTKATEASQSASQALGYKTDAEQAKTASQTAQGLAESARDDAITAKNDAESARDDAESARDEAVSAVASISGALADKAPVITDTASGSIASFTDGADDLPLKSLVVNINPIQDLSHGDPSPENICPISGWDAVGVEQRGVNIWDEEWMNGYYNMDGVFVPNSGYVASKNYIPIVPNTVYHCHSTARNTGRFCFYNIDKDCIMTQVYVSSATDFDFTTPENARYMQFDMTGAYGTTYNHDISINYPSTDHDYHPYTGRSITIDLGQTVYGGHLDVLSGVLTVDRAMVDLGTLRWYYNATFYPEWPYFHTITTTLGKKNGWNNGIMSAYRLSSNIFNRAEDFVFNCTPYYSGRSVNVRDSRYTDIATFKAAVSGVQFCYELETPIEIQLTPNQVNSLLGVNNLWADSGDTEAVYRADTKAYITKKIAEALASLT